MTVEETYAFWKAITQIEWPIAQVLIRKLVSNQTYKQVSEEMNIPLGTVMSRMFNGRKKLEQLIKKPSKAYNLAGIYVCTTCGRVIQTMNKYCRCEPDAALEGAKPMSTTGTICNDCGARCTCLIYDTTGIGRCYACHMKVCSQPTTPSAAPWICPRCGAVHGPLSLRCDCSLTIATKTSTSK